MYFSIFVHSRSWDFFENAKPESNLLNLYYWKVVNVETE